MAKLTDADYDRAWELYISGYKKSEIAKILGVTRQHGRYLIITRAIRIMKKYMPFTYKWDFIAWSQKKTKALIKVGIIDIKNYCEICGIKNKRIECHHNDYSNPRDVVFLCCSCHRKQHLRKSVANKLQ